MSENLVELTVTIPIPKEKKAMLDKLEYDYERNLIQQLKEVCDEIQRCFDNNDEYDPDKFIEAYEEDSEKQEAE